MKKLIALGLGASALASYLNVSPQLAIGLVIAVIVIFKIIF